MGRTTLSISDDTKARFDGLKGDESQDAFLNVLLDAYENDSEPSDVASSEDLDALCKRLEAVEGQLSNVPRDTADYLR